MRSAGVRPDDRVGGLWISRCSNSAYALCIVATSQSSAPSIGIDFNPEWVRNGLTPVGRALLPSQPCDLRANQKTGHPKSVRAMTRTTDQTLGDSREIETFERGAERAWVDLLTVPCEVTSARATRSLRVSPGCCCVVIFRPRAGPSPPEDPVPTAASTGGAAPTIQTNAPAPTHRTSDRPRPRTSATTGMPTMATRSPAVVRPAASWRSPCQGPGRRSVAPRCHGRWTRPPP